MQESLDMIANTANIIMSLMFCLYMGFGNRNQSTYLTLTCVVGFNLFMVLIEPSLLRIEDKHLLRFAWYNLFAICDIFLVLMMYHSHRRLKIPYGTAAKHTYICYIALAFLQVGSFLERTYQTYFIFDQIYAYAIPALNLTIMFSLTAIMLKELLFAQPVTYSKHK